MGLQIPCGVCSQTTTQSALWSSASAIGRNLPCVGTAEGMPDRRRAPDAGSCAYVHRHSPEIPGGLGDRVPQGGRMRSPNEVGVAVKDGVATLMGSVDSYT